MSATFSWQTCCRVTQGRPFCADTPATDAVGAINTDTRTIAPGQIFLAIAGAQFDGNGYVAQAFDQGAFAAIVSEAGAAQYGAQWPSDKPILVVPDTVEAYLQLAGHHRLQCPATVVALTGSSGKTTTKDMLFAAFSGLKRTQKTQKNFNNEIGVAQTLMALAPDTEILIVEMGMRGLGEIALLSRYARPDVALVVNVGPAHIGRLGSLENIATAKLEIVTGLDTRQGCLVYNGDDPLLQRRAPLNWQGRSVAYTLADTQPYAPSADGGMTYHWLGETGTLQVPGEHMVANAIGVLSVGQVLGLPVAAMMAGLAQYQPEGARWQTTPLRGVPDCLLINDAYNANPDSFKASLSALLKSPVHLDRQHILVLAGMKELGEHSEAYHRQLGRWLANQTLIHTLLLVGDEACGIEAGLKEAGISPPFSAVWFEDVKQAVHWLAADPQQLTHALLFLKGSRAYGLEEIPQYFEWLAQQGGAPCAPQA
ncbi:MAG: UDP-N-acetylmuramoyl-tripeptide--D-alanyl-D-alanine ligase [Candidatus Melainabacteria bacterium]